VPSFIREVPSTRLKLLMNRPSSLATWALIALRPKTTVGLSVGKKIVEGMVKCSSSTGTNVIGSPFPWAIATVVFEVPKSIPHAISFDPCVLSVFILNFIVNRPAAVHEQQSGIERGRFDLGELSVVN